MNEKIVGIQKWLGINQAGSDDTSLKLGEASEMRNWRVTQDGALRKRPGMKAVHTFPGEIQGTWCGYVGGDFPQLPGSGRYLHIFASRSCIPFSQNMQPIIPAN